MFGSNEKHINDWLVMLKEKNGSDLHLSANSLPYMRIHGDIRSVGDEILTNNYLKKIFFEILTPKQKEIFEKKGDLDFGYEIPKVARFRCNYFLDRRGICGVFRIIPSEIQSIDDLNLPSVLKDLALVNKGLILVTGPTGSGKSTTLSAMIDYINNHKRAHIITIEDPIEFVHENKKCLINQREVENHTENFASALKGALREDPDIILVGEMRDLETMKLAIEAAATGHVVFSTLHTIGATKTVDRIIEVFPAEEQNHIRSLLADVIQGVISQTLIKRADGQGRIAALEIMIATTGIRNLIRDCKTYQIPMVMETSKQSKMILMDEVIIEYIKKGLINKEDGLPLIMDKTKLKLIKESLTINNQKNKQSFLNIKRINSKINQSE